MAWKQTLTKHFSKALTNEALVSSVTSILQKQGLPASQRLITFSLCADELARSLEKAFTTPNFFFSLGGLAGYPHAGLTGFGAMASHVPEGEGGHVLFIYGPHVGVDSSAGLVARYGQAAPTTCCGSAIAATEWVLSPNPNKTPNPLDVQQMAVNLALLPHADRLKDEATRMVELPFAAYDGIDSMTCKIVEASKPSFPVVMLGGIQINTPYDESDYFLPLRFEMNDGGKVTDLMSTIQ